MKKRVSINMVQRVSDYNDRFINYDYQLVLRIGFVVNRDISESE